MFANLAGELTVNTGLAYPNLNVLKTVCKPCLSSPMHHYTMLLTIASVWDVTAACATKVHFGGM